MMTIRQTSKRVRVPFTNLHGFVSSTSLPVKGTGWKLYGFTTPDTCDWFERRFASLEAARAFADKRGWAFEVV